MNKLKAVIITNIPSPYRVDFFSYLQNNALGYEFYVIFSAAGMEGRKWSVKLEGLSRYRFLKSRTIRIRKRFDDRYVFLPTGVERELEDIAPDVLVAMEYNPTILRAVRWCEGRGVPIVSWTDGTLHSERNFGRVQMWARHYVVSRASAFIASSTASREAQVRYGADKKRCFLSYLTVDVDKYRHKKEDYGGKVLLFVGSLIQRKGLDLLLSALAGTDPSIRLRVVGEGQERPLLEAQAKRLGILPRVEFLGFIEGDRLREIYAESDAFILPTREDCYGLVILEAMCASLPVIASRYADGAFDLIEEGVNGVIVDPEDGEGLSRAIDDIFSDEGRLAKMGAASYERAARFSFSKVSGGVTRALDLATAGAPRAGRDGSLAAFQAESTHGSEESSSGSAAGSHGSAANTHGSAESSHASRRKGVREKILFNGLGNRGWIGGLYYLKNIIYSCLQSRAIRERYRLVVLIDPGHADIFSCFGRKIDLRVLDAGEGALGRARLALYEARLIWAGRVRYCYALELNRIGRLFARRGIFWIPDFQHKKLPEFFPKEEIAAKDENFRRVTEMKNTLVLSSEDSLHDLERYYPGHRCKARVVHFVSYIEPEIRAMTPGLERAVSEKFGLSGHYVYIPNQFWQHKNHIVVVRAIAEIARRGELPGVEFVFTGSLEDYRDPGYIGRLRAAMEEEPVRGRIRLLGFLDRAEQLCIMKNADLIVQPSLCEGWGTVLEDAKVLDKAVLLSDIPVHEEQKYEKCVLFDPMDAEGLADLIIEKAREPRDEDVRRGIRRMRKEAAEYARALEEVFL